MASVNTIVSDLWLVFEAQLLFQAWLVQAHYIELTLTCRSVYGTKLLTYTKYLMLYKLFISIYVVLLLFTFIITFS